MWVIRGGEQNRLVDRFVDQGVIGMDYIQVPDAEILTRLEIRRFLADGLAANTLDAHESMLSAFVREIQVGDSVLVLDPQRGEVVVGTVTGGYAFHGDLPADDFRHRRTVDWLARHAVEDLPAAVQSVARQRPALQQHRDAEWAGYLAQVREQLIGRDPKDRPARAAVTSTRRASSTARASTPRTPKAVVAQRTCPSCFLQTHPDRFRGDVCLDCAE